MVSVYKGQDDVWDYMAVTGAVYFSGAFALLVGGLYWKRASSTGAILALLAGFTALLGLSPVQDGTQEMLRRVAGQCPDLLPWLRWIPGTSLVDVAGAGAPCLSFAISSERVGLVSIGTTTLAMVVGSLLFPDRDHDPMAPLPHDAKDA